MTGNFDAISGRFAAHASGKLLVVTGKPAPPMTGVISVDPIGGDKPESIYMVVDEQRYNGRCGFDYGNVETSGNDDGDATMETLEWRR
jgi:hypothetical protein